MFDEDENVGEEFMDELRMSLEEMPAVESVDSFEEVMLLTDNNGFVLRLKDGREFQLTVVESTRRPPID